MLNCSLVGSFLRCTLVADLTDQFILMPFNFKHSRVDNLTSIFFNIVIIRCESFESNDKIFRKLCDQCIEQPLSLRLSFLSQVIFHEIINIYMVIHLIKNTSLLKLQSNNRKSFCLNLSRKTLILRWIFNTLDVWCFYSTLKKILKIKILFLFLKTTT